MPITAVKPVYDRKARTYRVEVVENAEPLLAGHGYFVFDDPARCLPLIESGKMLDHWNERQRAPVVEFLKTLV